MKRRVWFEVRTLLLTCAVLPFFVLWYGFIGMVLGGMLSPRGRM